MSETRAARFLRFLEGGATLPGHARTSIVAVCAVPAHILVYRQSPVMSTIA